MHRHQPQPQPQIQYQNQHQYQRQTQVQNQDPDQNQAQYRDVTPDNPAIDRGQQRRSAELQGLHDRYSYPKTTGRDDHPQQARRQPSISPEQRALITGIPIRNGHSARQPLAAMNGDANQNISVRTPLLVNGKSSTEMRAMNDSGFGMKATVSSKKTPANHPQSSSHMQAARNPSTEGRGPENRPRVPMDNGGNYGDRVMALQGRVQQGRPNGESGLRSELQDPPRTCLKLIILANAFTGNVQPRISM